MSAAPYDIKEYDEAARRLAVGELVAFPTETVYGLGANACDPAALARLFALKGRPLNHPVIVHIAQQADPSEWIAGSISPLAHRLIEAFWPGPLTLIFKRAAAIPDAVSGGQDTIGLRCPAHPVAQALLRAFSAYPKTTDVTHSLPRGIAAPSANRFGRVSPTTAAHVRDEFGDAVLVLDAGACQVGLESTILDVSQDRPVLLRAGQLHAGQLAEVIGAWPLYKEDLQDQQAIPRVSGALKAHYAPRIPLSLCDAQALPSVLKQYPAEHAIAWVTYSGFFPNVSAQSPTPSDNPSMPNVHSIQMPAQPDAYAHVLYQVLRDLEATNSQRILVETPPSDDPAWAAIHDRLSRAAAAFDNA